MDFKFGLDPSHVMMDTTRPGQTWGSREETEKAHYVYITTYVYLEHKYTC